MKVAAHERGDQKQLDMEAERRLTQDVAVRLLTYNRTEMKVVVCSGLIKVTEDAGWVS